MKSVWSTRIATALLTVLVPPVIHAQSGDYLNAPLLGKKQTILLTVQDTGNPDRPVKFFRVENCGDKDPLLLDDSWTVLNQSDTQVAICNYNPLTWKFSLTQKDADSTAWTNLQTIFSAAGTFAKGVVPIPALKAFAKGQPCELAEKINQADKWLNELGPMPQSWAKTIDDAYPTHTGSGAIKAAASAIDTQAKGARTAYSEIEKAIATFDPSKCGGAAIGDEYLLIRAEARLRALSSVAAALETLTKSLEKIESAPNWDARDPKAWRIGNPVQTSLRKSKSLTVTATPLEYQEVKTGEVDTTTFGVTTADPGTLTILVEKWWLLYPSPGAGPVFTTFEKPVYVAADSGSQKVVSLKKRQRLDASLSGSLNWVDHRNWHGIAPYLQTGFANSDDVNGLLLGGGLRLFGFGKTDVGVSGGWLLGWYKDLNHLKLNNVVADQDAIDNDLTRHFKTAPFACLQIKF